METINLVENVDNLFQSLENFTQKEGVIGKPVTQGDKTFMPVVSVTVGYGGGNASMKGQAGSSSSAGMGSTNSGTGALGLGAKLCTDAVILIDKENVSMLPINSGSNVSQMMDKVPQILTQMNQSKQSGQPQGQTQG